MTAQRSNIVRTIFTCIVTLLLFLPGFTLTTSSAQVASPAPSHGQVLAQGVAPIDGGQFEWYFNEMDAPAFAEDPLLVANSFVVVDDGQVLVTNISSEQKVLSDGQAIFSRMETEVVSTTADPAELFTVELAQASDSTDGIQMDPFEIRAGSYNLQLTGGILREGEVDEFRPVNDYPYVIVVEDGDINVRDIESDAVEPFLELDVGEWSGDIELTSVEDARYMIFSVGVEVPTQDRVPSVEPRPGSVNLTFYECSEAALTSPDLSNCALIEYPVQASLTQGATSLHTGMDAIEETDHSWLFQNLVPGAWDFQWIVGDGTPMPDIVLTGDAQLEGDQWQVIVRSGVTTSANVLIIPADSALDQDQGIDLSTLMVYFLECPAGWTEGMDLSSCGLSQSNPNLELRDVGGAGIVLNTDWDAVSTEAGVYEFSNIPPETYFLALAYDGNWTYENTYFLGNAYTDGLDWYVNVAAGEDGAEIYVVLGQAGDAPQAPSVTAPEAPSVTAPDAPAIPAPGSFGYAMIVQSECQPTQNEANCAPAVNPWEVYLTNVNTGEVYALSVEGVPMGNGTWMLIVPAGVYSVEVDTAGWYMEYSGTIEVIAESESYLYLEGFAP